jgi:hypothetical protein
MRVPLPRSGPAPEPAIQRAVWHDLAECLYGFDHQTALRLAFVRWLVETGRLGEDE